MAKFSKEIENLVENGKFNYGIYKSLILNVNPLDVDGRVGSITPKFIKDNYLKEWISYQISDERFFVFILLFSLKKSSNIQIILYDKKEKDLYSYSIDKPFFRIDIGKSILSSNIFYKDENVMIEILNKLGSKYIELNFEIFNLNNSNIKASIKATNDDIEPFVSCIPFENNNAMYSYRQLMNIAGSILIDDNFYKINDNASFIAYEQKSFYPHDFWWNLANASKKCDDNIFAFNLTENQSLFPNKYNENCFWINNRVFSLPSVKFLFDREKKLWKIIDEDGCIDLSFEVKVNVEVYKNYFISKSQYKTCLGIYNGFITDCNGHKIEIKDYFGFGEVVDISI